MKVLFAVSECVPFIKTGGLADVAGTLPAELSKLGLDVRVILPKYRDIGDEWKAQMQHVTSFNVNLGWRRQYCGIEKVQHNGVIYYFVDNEFYFARDSIYGSGNEEGERFGFFCKAALELLPQIDFIPNILHCNDWQTGMIPVLLALQYRNLPQYRDIRTVFTIHNLRYQGVFPWNWIDDMLGIGEKYYTPDYLEYYGCISFMKGGLVFSDIINTVSPTYAKEIQSPYFGERLDGLMRLRSHSLTGILNGIDNKLYDPAADEFIAANYDAADTSGKAVCKAALQREFELPERPDIPIIGMVTRFTEHKGLDLVEQVLNDIMRNDIQFVVLGMGEERYVELFNWAKWRYAGKFACKIEQSEPVARRVYAGSDIFLMPSHFEPCGLAQMIAMRYGAVPVVRETGGLKDSVIPYNKYTGEGNGFSFANYNAHELMFTLEQVIEYYHDAQVWPRIMRQAMDSYFGWDASAREYLSMYERVTGPVSANFKD